MLRQNLIKIIKTTKAYKITKPFFSGKGHVLCFHRILPASIQQRLNSPLSLETPPEIFEKSILFFRERNYNFISLDDLYDILIKRDFPKKFVVYTFDDGYLDNFQNAYPILQKYNVPFAIYITTSFPERTALMWWYALEDLILNNSRLQLKTQEQNYRFDCQTISEKNSAYGKISSLVRNLYPEQIRVLFEPYHINWNDYLSNNAMDWEQIKALSNDPLVTIGAHTLNHLVLKNLTDDEVRTEILDAKTILEEKLKIKIEHFAYPYGSVNEVGAREFAIAKQCGFKTSVTTRTANIFAGHANYLQCLPRVGIDISNPDLSLEFISNGTLHFKKNKFKRIVTD
ncbi:MAG: polysaccharide deacetylase family protein [FCB group bacterium]|jgi:peptidoglycan/xylan/chitin deacetylase (PgdA/CDA1 family)